MNAARPRIASLDGLRAISITMVIIGHFWTHPTARILANLGVHVFFVVSGYLITSLLQSERARYGTVSLPAFYRRRAFRIFPAAYAYILIIALLVPSSRGSLLYALTYTVSYKLDATAVQFMHLWSLSIEEQFYLLWPFVLAFAFRRRAIVAWSAMVFAAAFRLIVALHPAHFPPMYQQYSPLGAMDSLAAGCLLAIYEPIVQKKCAWMAQVPAIVIAMPLTAWVLSMSLFGGLASTLWGIVPLMIALSVFLLVKRRPWILNNQLAVGIGVLSYSLYLWQQPFSLEHNFGITASLLLIFGCALASYFLVEKPMLAISASMNSKNSQPSDELLAGDVGKNLKPFHRLYTVGSASSETRN